MTTNPAIKRTYRIIFVLLTWFALAGHFSQIVLQRAEDTNILRALVNYFSYFTIQSNWLVALWWSTAIVTRDQSDATAILKPKVKGAFTVYISVTMIAYAVLLANSWTPGGLDLILSTITHYITPLAFILDWVFFERMHTYQWRFALDWLIYPLLYFVYAMAYGAITGKSLYPFFNVSSLGAGGVAIQTALLLALFLVLASLYITVNKFWPEKYVTEGDNHAHD